jgi:hypothetical protein
MFGRWLALLRNGPDLLGATPLGADPKVARIGECDAPPRQDSGMLSTSGADAEFGRWDPAKSSPRSSMTRSRAHRPPEWRWRGPRWRRSRHRLR